MQFVYSVLKAAESADFRRDVDLFSVENRGLFRGLLPLSDLFWTKLEEAYLLVLQGREFNFLDHPGYCNSRLHRLQVLCYHGGSSRFCGAVRKVRLFSSLLSRLFRNRQGINECTIHTVFIHIQSFTHCLVVSLRTVQRLQAWVHTHVIYGLEMSLAPFTLPSLFMSGLSAKLAALLTGHPYWSWSSKRTVN